MAAVFSPEVESTVHKEDQCANHGAAPRSTRRSRTASLGRWTQRRSRRSCMCGNCRRGCILPHRAPQPCRRWVMRRSPPGREAPRLKLIIPHSHHTSTPPEAGVHPPHSESKGDATHHRSCTTRNAPCALPAAELQHTQLGYIRPHTPAAAAAAEEAEAPQPNCRSRPAISEDRNCCRRPTRLA